jgi:hypothetical protein
LSSGLKRAPAFTASEPALPALLEDEARAAAYQPLDFAAALRTLRQRRFRHPLLSLKP